MKEDKKINSHFLKLTGKAELPEAVDIGHNYGLMLTGSITAITESDNNDGTLNRMYRFEPVLVELVINKGETIKLKDTRSMSQLFRARIWKCWKNNEKSEMNFNDYYDKIMLNLIQNAEEIVEMYWK